MSIALANDQVRGLRARRPGRIVLAAGGYRSGSTLQYNLVGEYLEQVGSGCRAGYLEGDAAATLLPIWSLVDQVGLAVVKTHYAVTGSAAGAATSWLDLVADGRAVPLMSLRDWHDVAASMCRKFGVDITALGETALWQDNLREVEAWLAAGALVQRYDDLTADPVGAMAAAASFLGLAWDGAAAERAARAVAMPQALAVQEALATGTYHPRLLLHHDHVATPDGGAWRRWPRRDRRALERLVAPLIERQGVSWETPARWAARAS